MTAGDRLLEEKLKWRAARGSTYMGIDASTLLHVLRENPARAWDLLEERSGNHNLRHQYGGSQTKKEQK